MQASWQDVRTYVSDWAERAPKRWEIVMEKSDEFRQHVNELWKQAVKQLEEAKEILLRQRNRFEADLQRLRLERDKLLKKLGEQTHKLVNSGRIRLPELVKRTADRLSEVIDRLTKQGGSKRAAPKKKRAAKRK